MTDNDEDDPFIALTLSSDEDKKKQKEDNEVLLEAGQSFGLQSIMNDFRHLRRTRDLQEIYKECYGGFKDNQLGYVASKTVMKGKGEIYTNLSKP